MTPGKRRYDLIPPVALKLIADVLTQGAAKHGDMGWTTNPDWKRQYTAALFRHWEEYRAGVWLNPDGGLPHLAHVGANALILLAAELADRLKGT